MIKRVTVEDASKAILDSKNILIDVREPDETAALATTSARLFPMSEIDPSTFETDSGISKESHLYVLCRSGGRSMKVANALEEVGYKNLYNVEGGILAWQSSGLPTSSPEG